MTEMINNNNNKKKSRGLSKNPVINAFQQAGIWFKETAWIQVVLAVILVFGIIFSIPFIVKAATASVDTSKENIKYLKKYRKNYDELQNIVEGTSHKYTVVYYYNASDSTSATVGGMIKDYIFNSDYFNYDELKSSFVTVDLSRTKDADSKDYDITDEQITDLAERYKSVYNSKVWGFGKGGATYEYGGNNNLPLFNSSYTNGYDDAGMNEGTLTVPVNSWVIYENKADAELATLYPVWVSLSFNNLSSASSNTSKMGDFLNEFAAAMNYATDPDLITFVDSNKD